MNVAQLAFQIAALPESYVLMKIDVPDSGQPAAPRAPSISALNSQLTHLSLSIIVPRVCARADESKRTKRYDTSRTTTK